MSVNIYDGTNLIPIAGKTVPAPTPDYVDAQYSSSTTYSKGMTCIDGNVRYRYKNSTATSGHRPPNTTYWEVYSVSSQLDEKEVELFRYLGTTSLVNNYQRLPSQTINTSWNIWKNLYRYILIVPMSYSTVQRDNGEFGHYYPVNGAIYSTSHRDAVANEFIGWQGTIVNKCFVIQIELSTSNIKIDGSVYDQSSQTYNFGYVIYGIK